MTTYYSSQPLQLVPIVTPVTVSAASSYARAVPTHIHLLQQGNVGHTFGNDASGHFTSFLKYALTELPVWYNAPRPGWAGAYAIDQRYLPHLQPHGHAHNGTPYVLLDYVVEASRGPMVPQELWTPHSRRVWEQHVLRAELRPPTFFLHTNGAVGLALSDVLSGNFAICAAEEEINVGRSSIHLHIKFPGYKDWKRQFQTQENGKWITRRRLARHVGRAVEKYLRDAEPEPEPNPQRACWPLGRGGITAKDIFVIGIVHVSSGSWMPLLQLASSIEHPATAGWE